MILSLRFKNFYSLAEDIIIDFTADLSGRNSKNHLPENFIEYNNDKFVNILGIFGANASGKSNLIKSMDFCRSLILNSHLYTEVSELRLEPFKFNPDKPSEFFINFVYENIEYEYSFTLTKFKILSESLFYYPNRRRAKVFEREDTNHYSYGKGIVKRPSEIEVNTGPHTLFLSRASSMNRPVINSAYRFFAENIWIGFGHLDLTDLNKGDIEDNRELLLRALEISDSDIIDIRVSETEGNKFELLTYHYENPAISFNFEKEESEGTKRLIYLLTLLIKAIRRGTTFFLDEFDLKMHLRLAEFLIDVVRSSKKSQLVFTSHNPALINPEKLRLEQIVLVSKNKSGSSEFVALSEFDGINKNSDIQKGYLQGRFDGVPYIGNIKNIISDLMPIQ